MVELLSPVKQGHCKLVISEFCCYRANRNENKTQKIVTGPSFDDAIISTRED